jgi:hypothetical protein
MSRDESSELTVVYLLTRRFNTCEEFSLYIETEAQKRNITNYEMVIEYCDEENVDTTAIATLITHRLKQLIQAEAENLNLMKRKHGRLSI